MRAFEEKRKTSSSINACETLPLRLVYSKQNYLISCVH